MKYSTIFASLLAASFATANPIPEFDGNHHKGGKHISAKVFNSTKVFDSKIPDFTKTTLSTAYVTGLGNAKRNDDHHYTKYHDKGHHNGTHFNGHHDSFSKPHHFNLTATGHHPSNTLKGDHHNKSVPTYTDNDDHKFNPHVKRNLNFPSFGWPHASGATSTPVPSKSTVTPISSTSGSAVATGSYSGKGTFYSAGEGACGGTNSESDLIVAVSQQLYEEFEKNGDSNSDSLCGKQIKASYGNTTVIVTVVDECVGCGLFDLDFSKGAFTKLADEILGEIEVIWEWLT